MGNLFHYVKYYFNNLKINNPPTLFLRQVMVEMKPGQGRRNNNSGIEGKPVDIVPYAFVPENEMQPSIFFIL